VEDPLKQLPSSNAFGHARTSTEARGKNCMHTIFGRPTPFTTYDRPVKLAAGRKYRPSHAFVGNVIVEISIYFMPSQMPPNRSSWCKYAPSPPYRLPNSPLPLPYNAHAMHCALHHTEMAETLSLHFAFTILFFLRLCVVHNSTLIVSTRC
jgi:hypothetical protein